MKVARINLIIEKLFIYLLLMIFGGIVLHAPISVGFGVLFPQFALIIKAWKEILMIISGLLALYILFSQRRLRLFKDPLLVLSIFYIILHLILCLIIDSGLLSKFAGLAIDLRYIFFFCLVFVALRIWPKYIELFLWVGVIGATIAVTFGLLQIFILPNDILKYIGYSDATIAPYMTVDQNLDFIRINSTLRGPNPLGAYMIIVLSMILAFICHFCQKIKRNLKYLLLISVFCCLIVLWFSYSRSAIAAAIVSFLIVITFACSRKNIFKKVVMIIIGFLATIFAVVLIFGNSYLISNILMHQNTDGDISMNSNDGHLMSIVDGLRLMAVQPFGGGIGSTGSASLLSSSPLIIENQYLFIAHEAGWLGLVLFLAIFCLVIIRLWRNRYSWLTVGVLASGIGLAIIGLLLPVWVDDTVSIIWWGSAAVIIGSNYGKSKIEQKSA